LEYQPIPVKYPQGSKNNCLPCSLASAIHSAGMETEAAEIMKLCVDSGVSPTDMYDTVRDCARKLLKSDSPKLKWTHDLLDPRNITEYPKTVILQDSAGFRGHAITCIGRHIFDSNWPHSLPLSQVFLDVVCHPHVYKHVAKGYHYVPRPKRKRKRKVKKGQEEVETSRAFNAINGRRPRLL